MFPLLYFGKGETCTKVSGLKHVSLEISCGLVLEANKAPLKLN